MDPADYSRISLRSIVNDIASDERDDESQLSSSPSFFASQVEEKERERESLAKFDTKDREENEFPFFSLSR